jgi:hypothetical protein
MIKTETRGLNELIESLHMVAENLAKETYVALSKAGNKTARAMTQQVTAELNVAAKVVRKQIKIRKQRENLTVTCSLAKSPRIPLRDFKARETKKGVSARIEKKKGVTHYPGAFIVKKFGGNVYTRTKSGARGPILKMKGASPFGSLVKRSLNRVVEISTEEVKKQLAERIRYLNLKKQGGLNWQQNTEE